jgi:hypothetical protein
MMRSHAHMRHPDAIEPFRLRMALELLDIAIACSEKSEGYF